jgi:hypothetical protein
MKLARFGATGSEQPGLIDAAEIPRVAGSGHKPDPICLIDDDCPSLGIEGLREQEQRIVTWEKRLKTLFS